jgi:hypothetical protein
MQPVSKQQIGKHASTKIELLLKTVFPIRSVQIGCKEENWGNQFSWALWGILRTDGDTVPLQECCCEKKTLCVLQLQWDSYNYYVKIRCQDTTSEDWEDLACASGL